MRVERRLERIDSNNDDDRTIILLVGQDNDAFYCMELLPWDLDLNWEMEFTHASLAVCFSV